MKLQFSLFAVLSCNYLSEVDAFVSNKSANRLASSFVSSTAVDEAEAEPSPSAAPEVDDIAERRRKAKESLFGLIGTKPATAASQSTLGFTDPILADPVSKTQLKLSTEGALLGGQTKSSKGSVKMILKSDDNTYEGRSNTYYDLLRTSSQEQKLLSKEEEKDVSGENSSSSMTDVVNSLRVFIPPPVRNVLATTGVLPGDDYIPMRDLFTSPQVSFAYERGWRQGFASAGFPGADEEASLVQEYFAGGVIPTETVVDMSCATGLFTRRLAKSGLYQRVIGCDYSDSMLREARRRIEADSDLTGSGSDSTTLDLVRLDVGDIPMVSESVDALHAGAAMHCWPDLDAALSEIYRVLKPNGRFFASTFLSTYFSTVQAAGGDGNINQQAFQYFKSTDVLKEMVLKAGFEEDKVQIEVLGAACVIIRAEK